VTTPELTYVPIKEIARVRGAKADPIRRAAAFAAICRINTLYMIARAGSGHIGSSFSSLDIVSWLHLEELRGLGRSEPEPRDLFFSSKGHDVPASTPSSSDSAFFPSIGSTCSAGWAVCRAILTWARRGS